MKSSIINMVKVKAKNISQPILQVENLNWVKNSNINNTNKILLVKYDFIGETIHELNINRGEYLKLLNDPGNGWLKVSGINSLKIGYIPQSYVDYVDFSKIEPDYNISQFFHDKSNEDLSLDLSEKLVYSPTMPKEFSFHSLSTYTSLIDNYDIHSHEENSDRSDQTDPSSVDEKSALSITLSNSSENSKELPQIPKSKSLWNFKRSSTKPTETPIKVTSYNPEKSMQRKSYPESDLPVSPKSKAPEHSHFKNSYRDYYPTHTISLPKHYNRFSQEDIPPKSLKRSSRSPLLTSIEFKPPPKNDKTRFTNAVDDMEELDDELLFNRRKDLLVNLTLLDNHIKHDSVDSIFSKQPTTPILQDSFDNCFPLGTPTTPIFEEEDHEGEYSRPILPLNVHRKDKSTPPPTPTDLTDFIKIKVFLCNEEEDIIAVKIKRSNLISITYLKKLISSKIYKDYSLINHYNLQVKNDRYQGEEELLKYIKSNSKVSLCLVRKRLSIEKH